MQLRFDCDLTGEEYVTQQAWRNASLPCCPLHAEGDCGFTRHGTYERHSPPGTRIARWYCRQGRCTFSLLPDCLAARVPGTLAEVDASCPSRRAGQEPGGGVYESAPSEIELPGVLRWVRRRVQAIHASLNTLKGLMPERFAGCEPSLAAFAEHLGVEGVLAVLRQIAAPYLPSLPAPLGFSPRHQGGGEPGRSRQQPAGPDPPAWFA